MDLARAPMMTTSLRSEACKIPTAYATAMMKSRRVSSELYLKNLFSSTGVTLLAW